MNILDVLLLFIVGSFLGFVIETIYCYLMKGKIESRRGVVYGPFNQVYGLGAVLMTILLSPFAEKNPLALFIFSGILGGLFEAACSLYQEKAYGTISWKYSGQRFSFFGGRTSLRFMFFWGLLGTVYIGLLHPLLFGFFQKIPVYVKSVAVIPMFLFILYDLWLSDLAVQRWRRRLSHLPANDSWDVWLDKHFTNERMLKIYPSMMSADRKKMA